MSAYYKCVCWKYFQWALNKHTIIFIKKMNLKNLSVKTGHFISAFLCYICTLEKRLVTYFVHNLFCDSSISEKRDPVFRAQLYLNMFWLGIMVEERIYLFIYFIQHHGCSHDRCHAELCCSSFIFGSVQSPRSWNYLIRPFINHVGIRGSYMMAKLMAMFLEYALAQKLTCYTDLTILHLKYGRKFDD